MSSDLRSFARGSAFVTTLFHLSKLVFIAVNNMFGNPTSCIDHNLAQYLKYFKNGVSDHFRSHFVSYKSLCQLIDDKEFPGALNRLRLETTDVSDFFESEINRLNADFEETRETLKELQDNRGFKQQTEMQRRLGMIKKKQLSLKVSLISLYREMEVLKQFGHTNAAIVKALVTEMSKKKPLTYDADKLYYQHAQRAPFKGMDELGELMHMVEDIFAHFFTSRDHQKALRSLRIPTSSHKETDIFKLAFSLGIIVPLIVLLTNLMTMKPYHNVPSFWDIFPVYRCSFLVISYIWLFGGNILIWNRFRIHHAYIFELDIKKALNYVKVWKTAAIISAVWCCCFFLYLAAATGIINVFRLDMEWYPLICIFVLITLFSLPLRFLHASARWTVAKVFYNLVITPFGYNRFRETFAADILTSMAIPIQDFSYIGCYYFSGYWKKDVELNQCQTYKPLYGPLFALFPYFCRLMQCLRQYHDTRSFPVLINCGKYISSIVVIFFSTLSSNVENQAWGVFRVFWICCVIFSTLYSFSWDILMDWGLLRYKEKNFFLCIPLRKEVFYPKSVYIVAIIFNFFARFAWAATLLANSIFYSNKDFLQIGFAAIELTRRMVWSCFRLELAQIQQQSFENVGWVTHEQNIDSLSNHPLG